MMDNKDEEGKAIIGAFFIAGLLAVLFVSWIVS